MYPPHGRPPGHAPGYPPNSPIAPQGPYGMQPSAPHALAPRTVYGVPLEDGERVIYYQQNSHAAGRIFQFIMGFPMILMFGIGLWFIYHAITMRKSDCFAQVITNRRLLSISGRGVPLWAVRWEEVVGLNKVSGKYDRFGVRNGAGTEFLFSDDVRRVEQAIKYFVQSAQLREQAPEVRYDAGVI